jgi:membrane protein
MNCKVKRLLDFFEKDIWALRISDMPGSKSAGIKLLRIVVLSVKDFIRDQCQIRASALTFYSILSIVPVVAMLFAISKGFGLEAILKSSLLEKFSEPAQQDIIFQIFEFAEKMLHTVKGGVIAGIGVIILIWTVVKLFSNIEVSFNHIWRIKRNRPFWVKLRDYIIIVVFAAVAIIFSSSLTVFVSTQLNNIASSHEILKTLGAPLVFLTIKLLPYVVMWVFFSTLYKFMPNTRVNYSSALIAGIITGTVFQFIQVFFIYLQVMLSKSNAIYGSLSALPLLFLWTQLTWMVVLFGAEISFAHQNSRSFEFEFFTDKISHKAFKTYAVKTAAFIVQNFYRDQPPCDAIVIARVCRMSAGLTQKILYMLMDVNVICESIDHKDDESIVYQPICNAGDISMSELLRRIDNNGMDYIEHDDTDFNFIAGRIDKLESSGGKSQQKDPLLKDLSLSEEMFA